MSRERARHARIRSSALILQRLIAILIGSAALSPCPGRCVRRRPHTPRRGDADPGHPTPHASGIRASDRRADTGARLAHRRVPQRIRARSPRAAPGTEPEAWIAQSPRCSLRSLSALWSERRRRNDRERPNTRALAVTAPPARVGGCARHSARAPTPTLPSPAPAPPTPGGRATARERRSARRRMRAPAAAEATSAHPPRRARMLPW